MVMRFDVYAVLFTDAKTSLGGSGCVLPYVRSASDMPHSQDAAGHHPRECTSVGAYLGLVVVG